MGALVLERSTVLAAQRRADGIHDALDGLAAGEPLQQDRAR